MQRPHHFQATVGPRHGAYPPVRNPWVDKHADSSSSSASPSGRSHRPLPQQPAVNSIPAATDWLRPGGPPPASEWLRPAARLQVPVTFPPASAPGHSVHSSSAGVSAIGAVTGGGSGDSCGGQCAGCDAFMYHCLRVVYIAGILTGMSLIIAGSVLRGSSRQRDLLVLVYIGVLLAGVCTVLLSVHICVRRNVKERKRALRLSRQQPRPPATPPAQHTTIYMQDFPSQDQPDISELRHAHSLPRRDSSRSRSVPTHSSSRRYYMEEPQQGRSQDKWGRQPYQPFLQRAPQDKMRGSESNRSNWHASRESDEES